VYGKRVTVASKEYGDAAADLINDIEEKMYFHSIMDALSLHKTMEQRSNHALTNIMGVERRFKRCDVFWEKTLETFSTMNYLLSVIIGIAFVRADELKMGNLVAFFAAVGQLNSALAAFAKATYQYHLVRVSLANLKIVTDIEPLLFGDQDVTEPSSSRSLHQLPQRSSPRSASKVVPMRDSALAKTAGNVMQTNQGELAGKKIEFVGVWFSYPASVSRILYSDLSFAIPLFGCTALIGKSGSGKSTFARLLMRLFQPCAGHVLVGGHHINDLRIEDLFSWCDQEAILFSGTIRENILVADLSCSHARMIRAAKLAELHDEVMGFPEKYSLDIGARGSRLSGGLRQRIALARALVKNSLILVLDEYTSAQDPALRNSIERGLCQNQRDSQTLDWKRRSKSGVVIKTLVSITHNLESPALYDHIVLFDAGDVVASGSHHEMLSHDGGAYQDYMRTQNSVNMDEDGNFILKPAALKQIWVTCVLNSESAHQVCNLFSPKRLMQDQILYTKGSELDQLYILARGALKVGHTTYSTGDVLDAESLVEAVIATDHAMALNAETVVLALNRHSFHQVTA
jgi:ABC-type multidrug transport system fused ATPase/permease subunit